MKKTLSFAVIHFTIAFTIAYILTGSFLIGSLIALLEPSVNTVAFYFHEKAWYQFSFLKTINNDYIKTTSFAFIHFNVAFSVSYLLTGSFVVGGIMALIEPSFNTVAYFFHEKLWKGKQPAVAKVC